MKKLYPLLYPILFLFPIAHCSGLSWSSEKEPGFSIAVESSMESVAIDKKLQIRATFYGEKGFRVAREELRRNLLSNSGFGPPPFSLIAEEAAVQEGNIERLLYTLDPQIPGDYFLSFGNVIFISEENNGESVEFMTGTFPVTITMAKDRVDSDPWPANLMKLTTALPIAISEENIDRYIESPLVVRREEEAMRRRLIPKAGSYSGILFVLSIKFLILIYGLLK